MSTLHDYQAAFTAHLRNPQQCAKPRGTASRRMAVYRQIVFNNFASSVSSCFPVLQRILGKRRFRQLLRLCFHSQHFSSPLFRELPDAFVEFLQSLDLLAHDLPAYAAQLAHYEWMELAVANLPDTPATAYATSDDPADLLRYRLGLHPAHRLLAYDYPVHRLSQRHAQATPEPTFLCLWRQPDFSLEFIQLNALTHALLTQLAAGQLTAEVVLQGLTTSQPQLDAQTVLQFGMQTLQQLQQRGLLLLLR